LPVSRRSVESAAANQSRFRKANAKDDGGDENPSA
jgi:hypothetical protein